jgi:RNA polymerase sigma-70 factor, ECF subfamily
VKVIAAIGVLSGSLRRNVSPKPGQRLPTDGSPIADPPPAPGDAVTETAVESLPSPVLAEPRPRVPASLTDDAQLVAACRRGEARAMEMLYHQFKRRVFGMAHRIVGANDAEEVAQEVFVRVFRGLANFRGDSALSTWIYRLTVNASLSHLARRGRRQEVSDDNIPEVPATPEVERDPGLAARIEACLQQLPAGYRAILVLHDVEGLSHEECAAILDCRVGTCKSQLHKARARMRDLLGPMGVSMGERA